ncbi:hypothetical protein [Streptomyces sp. NPDC002205]|uniref:hypothetical protein n=1 Tax=Streptomyces sp. NPDC002205 TaxID=3154411 RepID=UPI003331F88B
MLQLVLLGGGQAVVALATVGLGLADPAAQGLLMDAQILRNVGDGPAHGSRAHGAHQGIYGVLPWCWWFSFARTVTLASGTPQISVQLSIRDLMWLTFLPNERVADKNFLFENSPPRKHKLRQVVDVVFGVHDDRAVELGSRIKQLKGRLNRSRAELAAATAFVTEQDGETATDPQVRLGAEHELASITAQLEELDQRGRAATSFAEDLRQTYRALTPDLEHVYAARARVVDVEWKVFS